MLSQAACTSLRLTSRWRTQAARHQRRARPSCSRFANPASRAKANASLRLATFRRARASSRRSLSSAYRTRLHFELKSDLASNLPTGHSITAKASEISGRSGDTPSVVKYKIFLKKQVEFSSQNNGRHFWIRASGAKYRKETVEERTQSKYQTGFQTINDHMNSSGLQTALGLQTARLGHSCVPNAYRDWNGKIGQITIHTMRDITAGEEITPNELRFAALLFEWRQFRVWARQGYYCNCVFAHFQPMLGRRWTRVSPR